MAPSDSPATRATRVPVVVAGLLLATLAIAFLASAWPHITAPFGDSDEGINGAVWGFDARAVRELGPIESRFGGVRTDHTKYATHPPGIVAETAVIETIVGEHGWSTRAPAWLGAIATIALLFLLLRALGLEPIVAAAATVAALACHMLFVYGAMLDTMVTAFPFALGLIIVWYRQWTDQRETKAWWVFALSTLTALGGWQACFLVGLCALAVAARARASKDWFIKAIPYAAGLVVGVVLTLGWAKWTYGNFDVLNDKFLRRSGGSEPVSMGDMIDFQLPWLSQLLGVGFFGWFACLASLRDRRYRPLAALSLVCVIGYALILREGSGGHQYWNYWGLLPAAVGIAYVLEALTRLLRERFAPSDAMITAVALALTLVVAAINFSRPNHAAEFIDDGIRVYDLVASTQLAPGQTDLPYIAEPYRVDDWLRYRGGPSGRPLMNADDLRSLARDHPDYRVLVLGSCASPDVTGICNVLTFGLAATDTPVPPRFESAKVLADRLPRA